MDPQNTYVVATIIVVLIPFLVTGIISMFKPEDWGGNWATVSAITTVFVGLIVGFAIAAGILVFAIWGLAQLLMGVG